MDVFSSTFDQKSMRLMARRTASSLTAPARVEELEKKD
jgi:hypothetical protein